MESCFITVAFNCMYCYRWVRLGMLCNPCGNMSACLPYIDGFASITSKFIIHVGYEILSKLDLRLGKQLLSFRVVKIVCTWWILFNFFTNSLEMLPLHCNTNFCFSVFSCYFTATTALYLCLLLCSFTRSWLIVSLTVFPTQWLGYWLRSQIFSFFVNASWNASQLLVARNRRCIVPCITLFVWYRGAQLR